MSQGRKGGEGGCVGRRRTETSPKRRRRRRIMGRRRFLKRGSMESIDETTSKVEDCGSDGGERNDGLAYINPTFQCK